MIQIDDEKTLMLLNRDTIMDREVVGLVRGRYRSSNRCSFGPSHGTHLPLLLDEVLQGRPRASQSSLLQLPAVVLAIIFDFLADDKPTLASLALANSDCRCIARSYQFAEIYLDYSPRAQQLMLALVEQACNPARDEARQSPIGICVRRIIFASSADWVAHAHEDLYESARNEFAFGYPRPVPADQIERAQEHYIKVRNTTLTAIARAMPNLRRLMWADTFPLDEDFFSCLARSPVRELELKKVLIDPTWRIEPPWTPDIWPLLSLSIDNVLHIEPTDADLYGRTTAPEHIDCDFFDTLFQRCAPTLESLHWRHAKYHPVSWSPSIKFRGHPFAFPRLRSLRLNFDHNTVPGLSSLLASPIRHLELSATIWILFSVTISACRSLRDLETFVIDALPDEPKSCARVCKFIARQTKLRKLVVHEDPSRHADLVPVERYLMPALASGTFSNLRSLSLGWGGHSNGHAPLPNTRFVPANPLAVVESMESLEQLSLSLMTTQFARMWLIDHDQVRTQLEKLKKLKILAFSRDTYPIPSDSFRPDHYYMLKLLTDEERADADARGEFEPDDGPPQNRREIEREIWERLHRDRMLRHAEQYAAVLPALEWMLCGERPIGFERDVEDPASAPRAVPLTEGRNASLSFLQLTFGLGPNNGLWADANANL